MWHLISADFNFSGFGGLFFLICKNVSSEIQSRKTVGWMFHHGLCSTLTNVAFSF